MNVKRIVVDELPESCRKCFFLAIHKEMDCADYWCDLKIKVLDAKFVTGDYKERPSWCPLEVEEVCEKRIYKTLDNLICATQDEEGYNCETLM